MPVLTTLTLPWRQKIGVVFIFGVGLLYVEPFTIPTFSTFSYYAITCSNFISDLTNRMET